MKKTQEQYKKQKTILVVDDQAGVLDFITAILVKGNFNVLSASSGVAALEQSQDYKGEIHLLLSNFQMDGMDGIELATEVSIERPKIQMLLMSGFIGGMLVLNGGWHYLPKPFIASRLRALVAGLLSADKDAKVVSYPLPH